MKDTSENGVNVYTATCIGCKEEFEDFYFDGDAPDDLTVCDGCAATMEP